MRELVFANCNGEDITWPEKERGGGGFSKATMSHLSLCVSSVEGFWPRRDISEVGEGTLRT
jgi:hypothetical protein